jgi:hypothetical protein
MRLYLKKTAIFVVMNDTRPRIRREDARSIKYGSWKVKIKYAPILVD